MSSQQPPSGPPYAPTTAGLGGRATVAVDIPTCACLMLFYIGAAVGNMTILQLNQRKRGHKFVINGALFGFCMSRILTLSLRMGTATHPHNVSLSIAANIFVNAGILIIYVINLVLTIRIFRARQPHLAWNQGLRVVIRILYALVAVSIILLIVFIITNAYTLSKSFHQTTRDVQLAALTYFLVFSCLSLAVLAVTYALKPSPDAVTFGTGKMSTKAIILLWTSCLCVLDSGFKAGSMWMPPRPLQSPEWYDQRAAFYVFLFGVEIIILYTFLIMRIDRRFYVPDGSSKRKSFEAPEQVEVAEQKEASEVSLPPYPRPTYEAARPRTGESEEDASDKESSKDLSSPV